jgi:hypothetical protein
MKQQDRIQILYERVKELEEMNHILAKISLNLSSEVSNTNRKLLELIKSS